MENSGLFSFEWPVDQNGYLLEEVEPEAKSSAARTLLGPKRIIRPKGGPIRYYRPLEEQVGLARMFADIQSSADQEVAFIEFANKYGMLGTFSSQPYIASDPRHSERLKDWAFEAEMMATMKDFIDRRQLEAASGIFNGLNRSWNLIPKIRYERAQRPKLELVPDTLAGVMWLQFAGELTNGTSFKRCLWCPTWFPIGPGSPHRESRKFCSDACKTAWHRNQRKEAQSEKV